MKNYNDLFTAINAIGEKLAFTSDLRFTTLDIFKDQIDSLIPPTWKQIMTGIQEPSIVAQEIMPSLIDLSTTQNHISLLARQIDVINEPFISLHDSWNQITGPLTTVAENLKANVYAAYFDSGYKLSLIKQMLPMINFEHFRDGQSLLSKLGNSLRIFNNELMPSINRFYESQESVQNILQLPAFVLPETSQEAFLHAYCLRNMASTEESSVEEDQLIQVIEKENADCIDLLECVNPKLIIPFRGAHEAIHQQNTDRKRHIISSVRELWNNLLPTLAPKDEVLLWIPNQNEEYIVKDKPTKKARIMYICRNINNGPLSEFVEVDVKAFIKFLDALNRVHELDPSLTEAQLNSILIRSDSAIKYLVNIWKETQDSK
ncbi:MAG TPA: hypothetical protein P5523_08760 [Bacteroidales bacterium]|nr:hypothetical protein [Bacteroidales bacterium]